MFNYDELKNFILDNLPDALPKRYEGCEVSITEKLKGNEVLDEIAVRIPGDPVAIAIVYKPIYEAYLDGKETPQSILTGLSDLVNEGEEERLKVKLVAKNFDDLKTWDSVKDIVEPHLINVDLNTAICMDSPVTPVAEDMAMVYYIRLLDEGDRSLVTRITNGLFETLDVSLKELHEKAMSNIREDIRINNIENQLLGLIGGEVLETEGNLSSFMPDKKECVGVPLYVVTVKDGMYGAAVLGDKEVIAEIADKFDTDLVIFPSSVHEILIQSMENVTKEDLLHYEGMVKEINETQVSPDEVLSNSPYIWDQKERSLLTVKEYQKTMDLNKEPKTVKDILKALDKESAFER